MKTTVKSSELSKLAIELKTVLGFPIPGDAKLYLNLLYENVLVKNYEHIVSINDLIKVFGKENPDGTYTIADTIVTESGILPNPGMVEYDKRKQFLDLNEVEFEHFSFEPYILSEVKSKRVFPVLYRFFDIEFFN